MNDETREHFLAERRKGIGGSDAAAVCGLSQWRSPLEVYLDKRGELEPKPGNEKTEWGVLSENTVAVVYSRKNGIKIRRAPTLVSKERPYMRVNMDRQILGDPRGPGYLECKTADARALGLWRHGPPDEYQLQVQHGLAVTGYAFGVIAVLIGGNHYEQFEIARSDADIAALTDIEADFWLNHVAVGVPPSPDWEHPRTPELLSRMYGAVTGEIVTLPADICHWAAMESQAAGLIKRYEAARDAAKAHIQDALKDAAVGVLPDGSGTYVRSLVKRKETTIPASEFVTLRFRGKKERE